MRSWCIISQEAQSQEDEKRYLPADFGLQVPEKEDGQDDAQQVHHCRGSWFHHVNGDSGGSIRYGGVNIPPWVFAMMVKSERGMQRAWTVGSHVPRVGIHPSRMSRHVAVLMNAKTAMMM